MHKTTVITIILLAVTASATQAKAPKWFKKSRNAVCQIVAYDEKGNETGRATGFFTSADGYGITGYDIFSNASKAVAIDINGISRNIKYVTGANRIYDVARFKTDTYKPVQYLTATENPSQTGEALYIIQYSTDKSYLPQEYSISKCSEMTGGYTYYDLSGADICRNAAGAPVFDTNGNVIGILQNAVDGDTCNYAVDSRFAYSLAISSALALNEDDYRGMTFPKALPDNEEQALVYLYINQGGDSATYSGLLDRFIEQYPESSDGYLRKGTYLISSGDSLRFEEGRNTLDKSVTLSKDRDNALYEYSRLIYSTLTTSASTERDGWNLEAALNKIEEAISIERIPSYLQLQGNILFSMERFPEALADYQEINRTNMASPETYYYTSVIKGKMGIDADEIIATLDSAVNFYGKPYTSKVAPFILERATTKEGLQRYREAVLDLNEYEQTLGSASLSAEFYYFREQMEIKAKMYEQAMKDIERAVYLAPDDLGLSLEQVSLMLRVGLAEQALPLITELTDLNPDNTDCQRLLGICLMNTDNEAQAKVHFQKAADLGDEQAEKLLERLQQ